MWNELLLALNGNPGDVFVRQPDGVGIKVVDGVPHLHPSEQHMLNSLCEVGGVFAELDAFVSSRSTAAGGSAHAHTHGAAAVAPRELYLHAVRVGVDLRLQQYRSLLLDVEARVRAAPQTPLSTLLHTLAGWRLELPALAALARRVASGVVRGARVLDLLEGAAAAGVPVVEDAFATVAGPCRRVLANQLSAWLLHGLLLDDAGEFFVRAPEGGRGSWQSHVLDESLLPSSIPLRVAAKILFIGKATVIFNSRRSDLTLAHPYLDDADVAWVEAQLAGLHAPGASSLDLALLESTVDSLRARCAQSMWDMMTRVGQLGPLLGALRDYTLLGRGQLFLEFHHQADRFLKLPVAATTEADATAAYARAASLLRCDEAPEFSWFALCLRPPRYAPGGPDVATGDGWAELGFHVDVPWPMQLVFTDEVIAKYNCIFVFLLRVARAQFGLQRAWSGQMHTLKTRLRGDTTAVYTRLSNLRAKMSFLVDNLQYYLHVDVIDAQFSQLMASIDRSRDFDAVLAAHDDFLTTLLVQTFRKSATVCKLLGGLLGLCQDFCSLAEHRELWAHADRDLAELERLETAFDVQSQFLFKMLSSVGHKDHLAQLLLRIDFNGYHSARASDGK